MDRDPRPAVFVAPFLAPTTLRFLDAAARLPGVRMGLICQDSPEQLPAPGLRLGTRLCAVYWHLMGAIWLVLFVVLYYLN